MNKEYKVTKVKIHKIKETEKLYALEDRRNELIKKCAEEWSNLMEDATDIKPLFFQEALPTAFYDMMEDYDTDAGIAACVAFLREHRPELLKEKTGDDK